MKKFILFSLLVCLTAIGNTTFAAKSAEVTTIQLKNSKIDSRNHITTNEMINSLVVNDEEKSVRPLLCFATGAWEYASTAPDGSDYYNYVITVTCYSYKSPFTAQY